MVVARFEAEVGMETEHLRIDKWLHHVRVFKTRSLAAQACAKGNVRLLGQAVKPSRQVRFGDLVEVRRDDLVLDLRVLGLPPQRVGAPRVPEFCEDLTPPERREKAAALRKEQALQRPQPHELTGKPDKKQMRQLREWMESQSST